MLSIGLKYLQKVQIIPKISVDSHIGNFFTLDGQSKLQLTIAPRMELIHPANRCEIIIIYWKTKNLP